MHQTVLVGENVNEGAELSHLGHGAMVNGSDFHLGGDLLDAAHSFLGADAVSGGDLNHTVIGNVDFSAGFLGECPDY